MCANLTPLHLGKLLLEVGHVKGLVFEVVVIFGVVIFGVLIVVAGFFEAGDPTSVGFVFRSAYKL